MRLSFLLGFIPDEILLLGIAMVTIAYLFGWVSVSLFLGAVLLYVLLFTSFLDALLQDLSVGWWILIWIGVAVAFARGALGLLLGQRVADGLMSHLLRDLVLFPFKMIGGLIGMVFASLRHRLSHRLGGRIA